MKIPSDFDEEVPFVPGVELTAENGRLSPEEVAAIAVALQELLPPLSTGELSEWSADARASSVSRRI